MNRILKFILALVMMLLPLMLKAQSSCDELFREGQRLQQTMTRAAQNRAIALFQKAKVCYDSAQRKEICDQQIRTCYAIIQRLGEPAPVEQEPEAVDTVVVEQQVEEPAEPEHVNVLLRVEKGRDEIKFGARNPKPVTVEIICNYNDWEVIDKPLWITIYRNEAGLVITADNNDDEKREGKITIVCGDKSATIVVKQKKPSIFDKGRDAVGL